MVRFEDLRIFVAAADHGSFSAAARELDLSPAVASAALKRLELTLETRLFVRSTRSLRLTADGERYLEYARAAISTLEAGKNAMARDKTAISGTLSVSIPSDLGRHVLLPWLDDFQHQHPRVSFQVRISDRLADLYRQPVDIAIRYGTPNDSALVALPLSEHNRRVVCASPAYLARHGVPQAPADLRRHNCLSFVLGETLHDRWSFERDGTRTTVPVKGDRVG
ncbi:LysR family transcriptional regulator, partial [Achromobacter sp.]|uniref:LysR family transcriptional regulator n=1 Tax=Achromobacter sp. TaxID=134375 RepID=UPI0028A89615